MVKTQDFDIVGSYNNQRVQNIDPERSVNMFEYLDPLGKKPKILVWTSGLDETTYTFVGQDKGVRAEYVLLGYHYLVVGNGVYRIDGSGNLALLGTMVNTDSGYVGIDANSFQILFVDGIDGYIWDTLANVFTRITDQSFPSQPLDCCTLDNFFVVISGNTNSFNLSSCDQGLVWGPDQQTITADVGNNWLILPTTVNYQTGASFQLNSTGTLPAPLTTGTTYYAIYVDGTHIRVATTLANARAGIVITLTTNGTPTITIVSTGQLQQGKVETHPGTLIACRTLHRRIFFFSQYFTEIWENAGIGTTLPFRRNNSLLMEYGCAAIGSVVVGFDILMFISQDRDGLGSVMMVRGTESMPASTRALDYQLAQYYALGQIEDCRSFFVKENGIIFYRMNFTLANHTFVFNVTQSHPTTYQEELNDQYKYWHEEEILNGDRHPSQTHGCFNGINYVGDYNLPKLYALNVKTYTNAGQHIKRMRITRPKVPPGYQRLRVDRLQIDLLQGVLIPLVDRANLVTYLSISRNGGKSYDYELKAPLGQVGETHFRTVYRKLGTIPRGQPWVVKIEFYNNYPFIILGASWAVEELPE
jgi:hypothetical protein